MFKSTDGGGDWDLANTGLTSAYVWTLAIDPVIPTTLYAGTVNGVFKSTNDGENWNAVNVGLINTDVYALAIDPVTPSTLYIGGRLVACSKAQTVARTGVRLTLV